MQNGNVKPNVTVSIDLRDDVPADIGHVFAGKTVKRIYSQEHVPAILDCLAEKLLSARKTTKRDKFDVVIFGVAPDAILMMMAANLALWEEVETLWYAHPKGLPAKVFPID